MAKRIKLCEVHSLYSFNRVVHGRELDEVVRGVATGGISGYIPPKSVYLKFFYVVVLSL